MNSNLGDPLVGSLVAGRYRVLSRLGTGGMATVYLSMDTVLDRQVAFKALHPHLARDDSFRARLEREAKAAARLSHPHVVSVLDRGQDGEVFFLVMEYVPGRNLRQLLDESGPLAPRQALALVDAVVEGLAAAHAAGLIHRDIKPENVLLGDSGQIKVADFGLARAATSSTSTGLTFGTVAYIAPELVEQSGADARSDLYSAGIMLYELLTGVPPFRGDLPVHVALAHVTRDVPPPSELVPGLSRELDELVQWAAARQPDDRPVDADSLLGEIRHIRTHLSDEELDLVPSGAPSARAAAPAGATEVLAGGDGRGARAAGAPTEALAAVLQPTTAVPRPEPTAPPSAREAKRREREARKAAEAAAATPTRDLGPRRRGAVWAAVIVLLALVAAAAGWFFGVGPGSAATVPGVRDLTVAQARPLFERAGLAFSTREVFDDEVARGLIVGSTPEAGSEIRRFEDVSLLVSKGPQLFPLPDVRTKTLDAAEEALTAAGMTAGKVTEAFDEEVPAGAVISQKPAAGTDARRGTAVALAVSKGPKPIPVPQVVGMSQSQALAALRTAGLDPVVSSDEVHHRTIPRGAVAAQSPGADASLVKGGKVTLTISKGPRLVRVPDFIGKQASRAAAELRELGFEVRIENVLGGFFGTVRDQDPVDAEVPEGSVVTLTVV
ncbi:Stk1 family PASTA domain-containing Ser/Thr kinase [Sinomonas halotolerans]|uniref:non-specific serine/threonine protein kinase n=1 Tax=Sinomonas halotolerans TaxID=1644133 RepID=A0ABU9X663_9MICC